MKYKAGADVHLKFGIIAKPRPTIEWYKDGKEVKPSAQLSIVSSMDDSSIFIKDASRVNSGTYEMKIKNSLGSISATVRLQILGVHFIFQ